MYVVLLWAYIMEKSSLVRLSLTSKFSSGTFSEQKVALLGRGGMVTFCMLALCAGAELAGLWVAVLVAVLAVLAVLALLAVLAPLQERSISVAQSTVIEKAIYFIKNSFFIIY